MLIKSLIKKTFCVDNKNQNLKEAKKQAAMKLYNELLNNQNSKINQNIEKILKDITIESIESSNNNNSNNSNSIRNSKKNINANTNYYEKKIDSLLDNYKLINQTEERFNFSSDSNFSKIIDGVYHYNINSNKFSYIKSQYEKNKNKNNNKNNNHIDTKWLKIFEIKIDQKFENFKKIIFLIFKVLIFYKTYGLIRNYIDNKNEKDFSLNLFIKKNSLILFGYSLLTLVFLMNRSFNKRIIHSIFLDLENGQNLKIKKLNSINFEVIKIGNIYSITSRKKNIHEIFYFDAKGKKEQIFLNKNAYYDPLLIINICHPQSKSVKILH
jgi:hypothetical protein